MAPAQVEFVALVKDGARKRVRTLSNLARMIAKQKLRRAAKAKLCDAWTSKQLTDEVI